MIKDRYYDIFASGSTHVSLDQKREIVNRVMGYGIALDVREASVKDYDEGLIGSFSERWLHQWAEGLLNHWPFLREGKYEGLLDFILLDLFEATTAKVAVENGAAVMTTPFGLIAERRLQQFISDNGPMGLILAWGFHINYRTLTALSKGLHDMDALVEFIYGCDKRARSAVDLGWHSWTKIVEWILNGAKAKGALDEDCSFTMRGRQVLEEYRQVFGPLREIQPAYSVSTEGRGSHEAQT